MTEHDLSTLVREHVSSDEPAFAGPHDVIARGRRTVRTRRLTAGVGVAAALAVAGALVVPQLAGDPRPRSESNGIDPAIQKVLNSYEAEAMPEVLEGAARSVLSRTVPDLGPGEFSAYSDGKELQPGDYDRAGGMVVTFGTREHDWHVELLHAGSEAEGDPEQSCRQDLREGGYLKCAVTRLDNGDVAVERVIALQKAGPEWGWGWVARHQLDLFPSDILWFERQVEVIKSETFLTRSVEKVKAPSLEAAEQEMLVPVEDLIALGADPQLVIPQPEDYGDGTSQSIPGKMPSPAPER